MIKFTILLILFISFINIYSQDSSSKIREMIISKIIDNPYTVYFENIDVLRQISKLNDNDLRIVKNSIFARHGYKFKSKDLNEYFESKDWYNSTNNVIILSSIDSSNLSFLKIVSDKNNDVLDLLLNFYEDYNTAINSDKEYSKYYTPIIIVDSTFSNGYDGFGIIKLDTQLRLEKIVLVLGPIIWEYQESEYNDDYLTSDVKVYIFKDLILFAVEDDEYLIPYIIYSSSTVYETNLGLKAGNDINDLRRKFNLQLNEDKNYVIKFSQYCIRPIIIIKNKIVKSLLFVTCAG